MLTITTRYKGVVRVIKTYGNGPSMYLALISQGHTILRVGV